MALGHSKDSEIMFNYKMLGKDEMAKRLSHAVTLSVAERSRRVW